MHELIRRFDRKHGEEEALMAELAGFPGTFRVYATDIGPSGKRFHVEFKTPDRDAALDFLENDLTMG